MEEVCTGQKLLQTHKPPDLPPSIEFSSTANAPPVLTMKMMQVRVQTSSVISLFVVGLLVALEVAAY